jgi:hypothetical protein
MAVKSGNRRVQCLLCPKTVTLNNFSTHLKLKHPDQLGPRKQFFAELGAPLAPSGPVVPPLPVPAVHTARAPQVPPLDLDDIVLAVVEQLSEPAGMLPVADLPALFAWREATALFLRTVQLSSSAHS